MVDARYTYTAGIPAHRVGALVARARVASSLTDRSFADRLRVRLRTVRDWERGQVVPSDDQIEAIATTFGMRVNELLPRRKAMTYDATTGSLQLGNATTTLPATMRTNDDVLIAFLSLVRQERRLRPDRELSVRSDDLDALAEALDLDDDELEDRLMRVVGLSRRQAAEIRAQLLRRRLTAGVVAMIAGVGLLTANRAFSTGELHISAGAGGRVVRGDPFVRPTTVVSVAPDLTASSTITIAKASSATTATTTAPTTAVGSPLPPPTPAPTLPAVVLAAEVQPPVGQDARTEPPRSTPRPEVGPPETHPADPVTAPGTTTTTTTTGLLPDPPTLPPVTTPSLPPSSTPVTTTGSLPPPPPPPTTTTPVVSTVGGGGTTGTTEPPPPPTTTTTAPPPTTTTTTEPPTTTTTTEPPTTTTTTEPPTTTTTVTTAAP